MPTPPAPAPGAEVLSFSIMDAVIDDGNGQVKIEVDTLSADKNLPNDVTITDDGTESITLIAISKIGGGDGEQDVFRFDLSTFDDDFQITIADQGPEDIFYFEGVHAFVDNGDGTSTITYYGSDAALHTVTVDPDTAQIGIYYAPDGVVDGANGGEVMDVGYLDFQGDEIDGVDGVNDTIFGNAGSDTITGGAGNDTIFGDFDIETAGKPTPDLPANAFVGTPAGPATGAEVDTVTLDDVLIDNNGAATITIEDFADPDNENDVTINDGGTKDLVDLIIEKGGNTDEPDVFRLDLSGFNDDFAIELKNVDTTDKIVLTNVFTIEDNGDDTSTITYYGSDSALHTVVLTPDVAQIEAYITDDSPYFFDDTIYGGAGDDVIDGGYGDDTIDAGDDDDTVEGGVGDDNILGGAGADTIDGGDGSDTIDGGTGDDVIVGDRTGQAEGLADTIGYSYAQTITGDEASHFGEQGTGAANDPLNFIDRDLATDARFHVDDFFEYSFGQEVPAGTSITLTEGSGADDEIVNVYVSFGSTDPAGDANSGSGGGVGYQNAITGGQSVLVYSGPSDATVEFDVPMNATHIQFLGVVSHGGWAEIEFTDILNPLAPGDDIITGGDGNDTIDGGYGDDSIDGGADDDTIDGGWGDDSIIGGDGVDTLYGGDGDPDIPLERVAFKWSDIPDPDDGGQIDTGDTLEDGSQTVSGVQIDYTFSANKATFDTTSTATAGVDAGSGSVDPNSSISFDDTVTVDLNFSEAVTNVSFRINDFEGNTESMVIRAYDADGNLIPFSTTLGSNMSGSDADAIPGDDTFSGSGPEEGDTSLNNSMLVEIAGPVARIELEMSSTGGSLSASDIYFDDPNTGTNTAGNDVIDAGDGDDVIIAGLGTDTISGGIGSDTYDAAVSTDLSNDEITVVVDGMGDGTVDKAADGTTDTFSSIESFVADENASENDTITITDAVGASEATNLSDSSVGIFTPDGGGAPIAFGGFGEPTINDILTRSYDPGTGLVEPQGTYQITSGEEDGAEIGNISLENFEEINFSVICFARNTRILTMNGPVCVEDLKAGDRAITMDSGYQKIRWIGSKLVPALAELAPIRFRKGAIGNSRDLLVSPQHRMLVMDGRNELHFGDCEVLVPAKHLVNGTTIQRIEGGFVEYYHFLFDQHEIVFAEGAPAESFHPGSEGWGALSQASRDEITRLFPELKCGNFDSLGMTARRSLKKHEAALVAQY